MRRRASTSVRRFADGQERSDFGKDIDGLEQLIAFRGHNQCGRPWVKGHGLDIAFVGGSRYTSELSGDRVGRRPIDASAAWQVQGQIEGLGHADVRTGQNVTRARRFGGLPGSFRIARIGRTTSPE